MSSEFDLDQSMEIFRRANELGVPIADANDRYYHLIEHPYMAGLRDEPEFYAIAERGLQTEQQEAFGLRAAEIPLHHYSALHEECSRTETTIEELTVALGAVRERMTDEQRRYDDLVTAVSKVSPLGEKEAGELAERRKTELELAESAKIRDEIEGHTTYLSSLGELVAETGKAWPVPMALLASSEAGVVVEFIDEIPVDPPQLRPSQRKRLSELGERHVFTNEASKLAMFYLLEHRARVVTVGELVEWLYPPAVVARGKEARSLVTSMLGLVHGERIHKMLAQEDDGYILQYGWRYRVNPETRKRIGHPHRIYRVLELSDIDEVSDVIRGTEQVDTFDNATAHPEIELDEIEELCLPDLDKEEPEPAAEEPTDEAATEEPEEQSKEESDLPPRQIPPRKRQPGAKKIAAKKAPAKKAASSGGAAPAESKRRLTKWEQNLQKDVGEAITRLHDDNLMKDELLPANIISVRSSSALMGTQKALELMQEAGLLRSLPSDRTNRQKHLLTVTERVTMLVFNTHSQDFSERVRRKKAVQIVEDAVASFYQKHPEAR